MKGTVPELAFSRFYNCSYEAKLGREKHQLQLKVEQEVAGKSETVSLPIPLESINGVAVLPGANDFEKLFKAYDERGNLLKSIEHLVEIVKKKEAAFAEKNAELECISEIEDEVEVVDEEEVEETTVTEKPQLVDEEVEESESQKEEVVKDDEDLSKEKEEEKHEESGDDTQEVGDTEQAVEVEDGDIEKAVEEEVNESEVAEEEEGDDSSVAKIDTLEESVVDEEALKEAEAAKLEEMKKKAELEKKLEEEKKARKVKRQKRALVEAKVGKLKVSLEKAKQNLAEAKEKMRKIKEDFGTQFSYLESDTAESAEMLLLELKEGMKVSEDAGDLVEDEEVAVEEDSKSANGKLDEDTTEKDATQEKQTEVIDLTGACSCGANLVTDEKFCSACGVATDADQAAATKEEEEEEKHEMIKESPLYLFITLKKPLIKFYASNVETMLCDKDGLANVSMIIIGYNPQIPCAEHFKSLNEVMNGPWKGIRRRPERLFSDESPFSLDKTLCYLAKMFKRQDISDNTLDICELCEGEIKRMEMKIHVSKQCQMRDESCKFCDAIFIVKDMKEHHDTDCPHYPIRCPKKCRSAKIPRSKVDDHFKTCANSIVSCEFKDLGCEADLKRREVTSHMKNAAVEHVRLLRSQLMKVSSYLLSNDSALGVVFNPVPSPEPSDKEMSGTVAAATS